MLLLPTDSTGTDGEQGGVQKHAGAFAPNCSMSAIADDKIDTLHTLTIADEENWFEGRDGCVDALGGVQKSSNQKVAGSFEPTSTAGAFAPN